MSYIQSASPFWICVVASSSGSPIFITILSGLPAGWASADHSLNSGLRSNTISESGSYFVIMYGPVAGSGSVPMSLFGVPLGTTYANGSASFCSMSGSGALSLKVTVFAVSSATIPFERSHDFGFFPQASAPTMLE